MDENILVLTVLCGSLPLFLGSLAIVGWFTHTPPLVQLHPKLTPMQFNTALGFLGCGLSLVFLGLSEIHGVRIASLLILIIGVLTLVQYLGKFDFGLDQFFLRHYITVGTSHPGRMAPNTALCFILTALALTLNTSLHPSPSQLFVAEVLGASIFSLGMIACLGYLLHLPFAYGWGNFTKMALPTAIGFACLGFGILGYSSGIHVFSDSSKYSDTTVMVFLIGILGAVFLTLGTYIFLGNREGFVSWGHLVGDLGKRFQDLEEKEGKIHDSRETLRNLDHRYQQVREAERIRIAREFHDELGQTLIVIKFGLFSLKAKLGNNLASYQAKIQELERTVDKAVQSVQTLCLGLRTPILDSYELPDAMECHSLDFERRTGIHCNLSLAKENIRLHQSQVEGLLRVFQEALTNIARHAHATHIQVNLRLNHGHVDLFIHDNGVGITQSQIENSRSLGLIGMQERILHLGGVMDIQGVPGRGTRLHFRIPL